MSKHIAYIALGSNMTTATYMLAWVRRKFKVAFGASCYYSTPVWTEPIDYPYPFLFLNQIVQVTTHHSMSTLQILLKSIEEEMMRRRTKSGEGRRIIDIDLLSYDGQVLRPNDWLRPYIQEGVSVLTAGAGHKR